MTTRIETVIKEMAEAFERELGVKLQPEQMHRVETAVRQQFAGERVYVGKRADATSSSVMADSFARYHGRQAVRTMMRQFGISERTAYRRLNKK